MNKNIYSAIFLAVVIKLNILAGFYLGEYRVKNSMDIKFTVSIVVLIALNALVIVFRKKVM
jgi:hypothetical protein